MSSPLPVTAAVLERGGLILLAQRSRGALAGYWEFPGGKLEEGEAPEVCLRRELREELGIDAAIGVFLISTVHHYPQFSVELQVYRAVIERGEPVAQVHSALVWVPLKELRFYQLAPADWPVVDLLEQQAKMLNR